MNNVQRTQGLANLRFASTSAAAPRTAFQFHPYHLVDPSP